MYHGYNYRDEGSGLNDDYGYYEYVISNVPAGSGFEGPRAGLADEFFFSGSYVSYLDDDVWYDWYKREGKLPSHAIVRQGSRALMMAANGLVFIAMRLL